MFYVFIEQEKTLPKWYRTGGRETVRYLPLQVKEDYEKEMNHKEVNKYEKINVNEKCRVWIRLRCDVSNYPK